MMAPLMGNESIEAGAQENHRIDAPLEIGDREALIEDSDGLDKRATLGVVGKQYPGGRRKRAKIALVIAAGLVFAASAALMVKMAFHSAQSAKKAGEDTSGDELDEPNPPVLPDSMKLFHPPRNEQELEAMRATLAQYSDPMITWKEFSDSNNASRTEDHPEFTYTTDQHFTTRRTALLFAPGVYRNLDFQVGYYTSVLGLGAHPDDVLFTYCDKGPHCPALEKFTNRPPWGSGLDTFWRSIENIATDARHGMQWAVSQAAPLRRMHIQTNLHLFDGDAWVSGGVAANVVVDGEVDFGGQQQWLMRNAEMKNGAKNGAWSLVFVGCTGQVPEESEGKSGPSVSVENDPGVRVEKPYIVLRPVDSPETQTSRRMQQSALNSDQYRFELRVPSVTFGSEAIGPQFEDNREDVRDFRRVKLGVPSTASDPVVAARENHSALQKALDEGKDVVLSPGIYLLSESLVVRQSNQVILGLGFATLVAPKNGSPCIRIQPNVPGVRIAGLMLEASARKTQPSSSPRLRDDPLTGSSLLEWGTPDVNDPGDARNPGVLSDVFARVGGVHRDVSVDVMIRLRSGNIYGDNLWLWRADHVQLRPHEEPNFPHISAKYRQTISGECEAKNGLVVGKGASNVTIVGLAVEHTSEDQAVWNGDNGQAFFYQCELPYDADRSFGENEYVGYRVGLEVTKHKAIGLGIYSNFRDYNVEVETAVVHPATDDIEMGNIFTVKLDNQGAIRSIVNGHGPGPTVNDTERGRPYRCYDQTCSDQH